LLARRLCSPRRIGALRRPAALVVSAPSTICAPHALHDLYIHHHVRAGERGRRKPCSGCRPRCAGVVALFIRRAAFRRRRQPADAPAAGSSWRGAASRPRHRRARVVGRHQVLDDLRAPTTRHDSPAIHQAMVSASRDAASRGWRGLGSRPGDRRDGAGAGHGAGTRRADAECLGRRRRRPRRLRPHSEAQVEVQPQNPVVPQKAWAWRASSPNSRRAPTRRGIARGCASPARSRRASALWLRATRAGAVPGFPLDSPSVRFPQ